MNRSFSSFQPNETKAPQALYGEASLHTHPDDVANDPKLTTAQKRSLLASWISDARAVENAPALRRLDSGAIVEVDAIRRALASLDEFASERGGDRPRPSGGVISRLLHRAGRRSASKDDDDDPPPAPAGMRLPFHTNLIAAYGARPEPSPAFAHAA